MSVGMMVRHLVHGLVLEEVFGVASSQSLHPPMPGLQTIRMRCKAIASAKAIALLCHDR